MWLAVAMGGVSVGGRSRIGAVHDVVEVSRGVAYDRMSR